MKHDILYEVYEKRAILQGIDGLPLLARETNRQKAKEKAKQWGACVVEVTCTIITRIPMNREVITTRVVWTHETEAPEPPFGRMNVRQLRGKLNTMGYRGRRKR